MFIPSQLSEAIFQEGFFIIDHFLAESDHRSLQKLILQRYNAGSFNPAHIGRQEDKTRAPSIRNDEIFWLDPDSEEDALRCYFTQLKEISTTLNQMLYLGLMDYEAHFAVYQPNRFYKKHIDQFATKKERRISCVYYLNDHWQTDFGGELILYDRSHQPLNRIVPLGNRFVCFESDLPHEVTEAYRTRYSIAAWLKVRPLF